ncbi:MAG: HlyD family secretion protein [Acidocella sp.]|nr:HlyD family secretion protein [Acidocella sp.]
MELSPPRRNLRPFIILGVVLGVIALGCFGYWWLNKGYDSTSDAQIDGPIYTIAPQIAGRVAQVLVHDNQHVAAGQALVVLDSRAAHVALARAQAQAAQADAQNAVARAQAAEANAQEAEAQADLQQAQQNYDRYRQVNQRAITQQQRDAATATIMTMRARDNAAIAAQGAAQASMEAAQAAVQSAQVGVQNARLDLSYTVITAPGAGHVSIKTIEPGDVVAPGTAMMAVVGDAVWVTANFKETELGVIKPGAVAHIRVDAIPGIVFKARVNSIQYGTGAVFSLLPAQNATGNYIKIVQRVPVKLVFDDPRIGQYMLAPGMSCEPSIVIGP